MDIDLGALATHVVNLAARVTKIEQRLDNLNYKVDTVHRQSDETQRRVDAQLDQFRAEQLDGQRIQEILSAVYDLGRRLPGLEERMTTLEQRQAGDTNADRID